LLPWNEALEPVKLKNGGGTGIGLMISQALATNGAKVYIIGRRQEALDKVVNEYGKGASSGEIIALPGDVTSKTDLQRLADQIKQQEGFVHLLFNNAGVATDSATKGAEFDESDAEAVQETLWKSEPDSWLDTYKTNVVSHYFTSLAFLPLLAQGTKQRKGFSSCIVNTASISGLIKASSGSQYAYAASKAADIHLIRMLALQFTKLKVRVLGVLPGVFPSEMTTGDSDDKQKSHIEGGENLPAGRYGEDRDMAQTALFLATNQFLNGQMIAPDGGATLTGPAASM